MFSNFSDKIPTSIFVRSPDSIVEGHHLTRVVTRDYDDREIERYATTDGRFTIQVIRNEVVSLDKGQASNLNGTADSAYHQSTTSNSIPGYTAVVGAELKVMGIVFFAFALGLAFIIYSALLNDTDIDRVASQHYSSSIVVNADVSTNVISTAATHRKK